jgi:hypothetical protein
MSTITTTTAQAGEFIATEIAWWGCCSERLVSEKLAAAGFAVEASDVLAFAVQAGLVKQSPIGYTPTKRVNARVFGRKFAEWVAA